MRETYLNPPTSSARRDICLSVGMGGVRPFTTLPTHGAVVADITFIVSATVSVTTSTAATIIMTPATVATATYYWRMR